MMHYAEGQVDPRNYCAYCDLSIPEDMRVCRQERGRLVYYHIWCEQEKSEKERPRIVCLCGSTRFGDLFQQANLEETLAGRIVLSIGCNMKSDTELFGDMDPEQLKGIKVQLDDLHKRKIDLCDEILVLDKGGYIGESTASEIAYAQEHGKRIRYYSLESEHD